MDNNKKIAIIGLGYVGLPLAVEFGKKYKTIGFDINKQRVNSLKDALDHTLEVSTDSLKSVLINQEDMDYNVSSGLFLSFDIADIKHANIFIVTVPTPTDLNNRPDLTPLKKASEMIGKILKKGDIVIYESTVYPGVTEEFCMPILENISGLKYNIDFYLGYSPERINPGDKERTITNILKVTSGSTPEIAKEIDSLYQSIIIAGTYLAKNIKVAEAAKVIENSQRDINIAFVNELAKIFNLLKIDTQDVLEAASTKWNFLPFKPGLVGGHCIGVDPYYLAQKAQEVGYQSEIILSGRRLNDSMGHYVANELIKLMVKAGKKIKNSKILVLGITFKENCPDVRNTKVIDVVSQLKDFGAKVKIYDPWASKKEVSREYKLNTTNVVPNSLFDGIILTVSHNEFLNLDLDSLKNGNAPVYDVKGVLGSKADGRL
tara:strand:+ start:477 stop:1772 length:1296 start_codon:yes stop_codon:yes gene_type:complete